MEPQKLIGHSALAQLSQMAVDRVKETKLNWHYIQINEEAIIYSDKAEKELLKIAIDDIPISTIKMVVPTFKELIVEADNEIIILVHSDGSNEGINTKNFSDGQEQETDKP